MCIDAGRKNSGDGSRSTVRDGKFPARRRAVQRGVPIGVPAPKPVSGQVSKGTEFLAIVRHAASRLFSVARLQLAPFLREFGASQLNPRIERLFHAGFLFLEQRQPGLNPVERELCEILLLRRKPLPGAVRCHQIPRDQTGFLNPLLREFRADERF